METGHQLAEPPHLCARPAEATEPSQDTQTTEMPIDPQNQSDHNCRCGKHRGLGLLGCRESQLT